MNWFRLENAHAATVDARRRVRMYQEDAWQRSRRKKGPDPRVVKDVSDGGCGVQRVLLPLLYWVSSGLLACIGLAWGLPGWLLHSCRRRGAIPSTSPSFACNSMTAFQAPRDQRVRPRNTESRRSDRCFTGPCHDITPWRSTNRVLYVKLPCPSVLTSYSKVQFRHQKFYQVARKCKRGGGRGSPRPLLLPLCCLSSAF
jgi:hypothetical protein